MTTVYTGRNGSWYSVDDSNKIGEGGEGIVYDIPSKTGYVLKIYKPDKRTPERERKITAMLARPINGDALKMVAWPVDIVYENNQFVGFVMPKTKNTEPINALYKANNRISLSQKIAVARNLCAAVNTVHEAGQICGDLNPANILVDPQSGIITLVDTDSYHITDPQTNHVFRCGVGLGTYLPREIHAKMANGINLGNAPLPTFTESTDNFALAVHIFALLMNGCHPFACAKDLTVSQASIVLPQPETNICRGFSPFFKNESGITAPVYAPDYNYLPSEIQNLFNKAFVFGHSTPEKRPNAEEWYNALSNMLKTLKKCSLDPMHVYPASTSECPWCRIEGKKKMVFPPERGKDLYSNLRLTAKEAREGCTKILQGGDGNSFSCLIKPNLDYSNNKKTITFTRRGYPGKNGGDSGDFVLTLTVEPDTIPEKGKFFEKHPQIQPIVKLFVWVSVLMLFDLILLLFVGFFDNDPMPLQFFLPIGILSLPGLFYLTSLFTKKRNARISHKFYMVSLYSVPVLWIFLVVYAFVYGILFPTV